MPALGCSKYCISYAVQFQLMQQKSFSIEFFCVEAVGKPQQCRLVHYTADVTVVSMHFQLFKISAIKRLSGHNAVFLSQSQFITSYSSHPDELIWKNASTLQTNPWVQTIGSAIADKEKQWSLAE